jgi:hypothetical protein
VSCEHFLGHKNVVILVIAYDEEVLLPLLMEVYNSSLPLIEDPQAFESPNGGNLGDLFHTTNTTTNTWTNIIGTNLYGYYQYHID